MNSVPPPLNGLGWEGGEYWLRLRGQMRESIVFGEDLVLTREISARLGDNRFFVRDRVENVEHVRPRKLSRCLRGVFANASLDRGVVEETVEIRCEFERVARIANDGIVERARVIFAGRPAHRDAAGSQPARATASDGEIPSGIQPGASARSAGNADTGCSV